MTTDTDHVIGNSGNSPIAKQYLVVPDSHSSANQTDDNPCPTKCIPARFQTTDALLAPLSFPLSLYKTSVCWYLLVYDIQ